MRRRVSSARFVGRARELGDLVDAFDRAVSGEPTVALIEGEAGVGKTRLIAEFAAIARTRGATIVAGGCVELGDLSLPFAPIIEVLRALMRAYEPTPLARLLGAARDEAERLVPDLADALAEVPRPPGWTASSVDWEHRAADPASRSVRLELLLGVISRVSADRPLVVVLEDLHWADPSTLDLVAYVTRNLASERVVIVVTYRTDAIPPGHPLRHLAAELARDRRVERYELTPLADGEVRELIAEITGDRSGGSLSDLVIAHADGNPFFVEELVAAETRTEVPTVPTDLRELILDRVRRLPEPAAAIVRVVAVIGRGADEEALSAVSGLAGDTLDVALRAAKDDHVLVTAADGTYAFRHALLGEAVAEDVLPGERRRIHAAYATARAALPLPEGPGRAAEAAERARHWDAAGRPAEAFGASLAAADAAFRVAAFAEAGTQVDRALRLWGSVPDAAAIAGGDRATVAARAAQAWSLAGELELAVERSGVALAAVDPDRDPARAGVLGAQHASYLLGVNDDLSAVRAFDEALALLTTPDVIAERRRALVGRAAALMLLGRFGASAEACREALAIDVPGQQWVEGMARNYLGVDLASLGDIEGGLAELREARRISATPGAPPEAALEADHNLACMLDRADRLDEAARLALDGAARAEATGLGRRSGIGLRAVAALALLRAGRWSEADTILSACLDMAPRGEPAFIVRQGLATLSVGRGATAAARQHLDAATELAARTERADSQPPIVAAAAELALIERRWEDSSAAITSEVERLAGLEDGYWIAPLVALGIRAEAERSAAIRTRRARLGLDESRSRAERLYRTLDEAVARPGTRAASTLANAALAEAELRRVDGLADPAAWTAAAAAFEAVPEPPRAAYARIRAAEAILATHGPRADAAAALAAAAAVADRLGAAPLQQAVDELARRARLDLASAPTPLSGTDDPVRALGLTARELEILALVARGRTNRQIAEELFITEKTVGVHMTNLLGKLGVSNRADAGVIADRLGVGRQRPVVAVPSRGRGPGEGVSHERARRAFMFTDIVRSTDLIGVIGDDAWVDLRRWHDDRLRGLFVAHHGEEVDHAGDGFLVAFERSSDAIACAIAIQRALASHRREHGFAPSVRIGLHAAEATRTGVGFAGRAVHEGARIAGLAGPDEILASSDTVRDAALRRSLSAERMVRLKGIADPVSVVTVDWRSG